MDKLTRKHIESIIKENNTINDEYKNRLLGALDSFERDDRELIDIIKKTAESVLNNDNVSMVDLLLNSAGLTRETTQENIQEEFEKLTNEAVSKMQSSKYVDDFTRLSKEISLCRILYKYIAEHINDEIDPESLTTEESKKNKEAVTQEYEKIISEIEELLKTYDSSDNHGYKYEDEEEYIEDEFGKEYLEPIELIEGTNVRKPRLKGAQEDEIHYNAFIEEYYTRHKIDSKETENHLNLQNDFYHDKLDYVRALIYDIFANKRGSLSTLRWMYNYSLKETENLESVIAWYEKQIDEHPSQTEKYEGEIAIAKEQQKYYQDFIKQYEKELYFVNNLMSKLFNEPKLVGDVSISIDIKEQDGKLDASFSPLITVVDDENRKKYASYSISDDKVNNYWNDISVDNIDEKLQEFIQELIDGEYIDRDIQTIMNANVELKINHNVYVMPIKDLKKNLQVIMENGVHTFEMNIKEEKAKILVKKPTPSVEEQPEEVEQNEIVNDSKSIISKNRYLDSLTKEELENELELYTEYARVYSNNDSYKERIKELETRIELKNKEKQEDTVIEEIQPQENEITVEKPEEVQVVEEQKEDIVDNRKKIADLEKDLELYTRYVRENPNNDYFKDKASELENEIKSLEQKTTENIEVKEENVEEVDNEVSQPIPVVDESIQTNGEEVKETNEIFVDQNSSQNPIIKEQDIEQESKSFEFKPLNSEPENNEQKVTEENTSGSASEQDSKSNESFLDDLLFGDTSSQNEIDSSKDNNQDEPTPVGYDDTQSSGSFLSQEELAALLGDSSYAYDEDENQNQNVQSNGVEEPQTQNINPSQDEEKSEEQDASLDDESLYLPSGGGTTGYLGSIFSDDYVDNPTKSTSNGPLQSTKTEIKELDEIQNTSSNFPKEETEKLKEQSNVRKAKEIERKQRTDLEDFEKQLKDNVAAISAENKRKETIEFEKQRREEENRKLAIEKAKRAEQARMDAEKAEKQKQEEQKTNDEFAGAYRVVAKNKPDKFNKSIKYAIIGGIAAIFGSRTHIPVISPLLSAGGGLVLAGDFIANIANIYRSIRKFVLKGIALRKGVKVYFSNDSKVVMLNKDGSDLTYDQKEDIQFLIDRHINTFLSDDITPRVTLANLEQAFVVPYVDNGEKESIMFVSQKDQIAYNNAMAKNKSFENVEPETDIFASDEQEKTSDSEKQELSESPEEVERNRRFNQLIVDLIKLNKDSGAVGDDSFINDEYEKELYMVVDDISKVKLPTGYEYIAGIGIVNEDRSETEPIALPVYTKKEFKELTQKAKPQPDTQDYQLYVDSEVVDSIIEEYGDILLSDDAVDTLINNTYYSRKEIETAIEKYRDEYYSKIK